MSTLSMMDDGREIECIYWEPNGEIRIDDRGGVAGVTRIECYREAGQGGHVPWFAVWKGEHLMQRVNAAQVAGVVYSNAALTGGDSRAERRCPVCGGTPELCWSRHDAMKWIECCCGRGVEEYDTFSDAAVWSKWDKQNAGHQA